MNKVLVGVCVVIALAAVGVCVVLARLLSVVLAGVV